MSRIAFDAFSLGGPEAALLGHDVPGLRVRYVDATPEWIVGVADQLLAAREALAAREVSEIVAVLGRVGGRFLDAGDPLRAEALALLPPTSGLSAQMAVAVLDGMAADWTGERLMGLVRAELGDETVLDGFVPDPAGRAVMALGPALAVQIVAGSVPGVGVSALLRSLLVKAPTLLKPGRADCVLPVLFARALREADPTLAEAVAVVYWPGGAGALEDAALSRASLVTAYGSDETVSDLRARTPVTARFVAYHHRISVGIVGRDALTEDGVEAAAGEVARSVALFDQHGCVSPRLLFVEEGGDSSPAAFAEAVARQLGHLEERLPGGALGAGQASALHQLRGTAELMAAAGEISVIHGGSAAWTVILAKDAGPPGDGCGRLLRVRAVADAGDVPALLAPFSDHLQTVGVAGLGERLADTALALGRLGASRVVPFRSVAFPPPWWHHDGGGPLRDLLRWVDLEEE